MNWKGASSLMPLAFTAKKESWTDRLYHWEVSTSPRMMTLMDERVADIRQRARLSFHLWASKIGNSFGTSSLPHKGLSNQRRTWALREAYLSTDLRETGLAEGSHKERLGDLLVPPYFFIKRNSDWRLIVILGFLGHLSIFMLTKKLSNIPRFIPICPVQPQACTCK